MRYSNGQLVLFDEERRLDALIAVVVLVHAGESQHAVVVSLELGLGCVDTVRSRNRVQGLNDLEKVEVDHSGLGATQELLVSEPFSDFGEFLHAFAEGGLLVGALETRHDESHKAVLNDALEHQNVGALFSVLAHK